MTDIPELTEEQLERAIPARVRKRLMQGRFESGDDIVALRRFVGLTQTDFARASEISVHTLRNWEQGRRRPEGPAIALLRIAARHPRIIQPGPSSSAAPRRRLACDHSVPVFPLIPARDRATT
jgi:DNA-binding transcriptional regulator YiaG